MNTHIKRLSVTIEPFEHLLVAGPSRELHVTVETADQLYHCRCPFPEDHFEDLFGHLMARAEAEIRRLVADSRRPRKEDAPVKGPEL